MEESENREPGGDRADALDDRDEDSDAAQLLAAAMHRPDEAGVGDGA